MRELIKLHDAFKHITFEEENHVYKQEGSDTPLVSVTTRLKDYKKPFDTKYWAAYKQLQKDGYTVKFKRELVGRGIQTDKGIFLPEDVDSTEIEDEWEYLATYGQTRGSVLHDFGENRLVGKYRRTCYDLGFLKEEDEVTFKIQVELLKSMFEKFVKENPHLIPIKSELVVGSIEYLTGGMIDQLFYNVKSGKFELWDWKTDKKFRESSKYDKMLGICSDLDDCELNKYSLQVGMYKHIFQEETGIELGDSHVVWFCVENPTYQIIKLKDLSEHVKLIFDDTKERN